MGVNVNLAKGDALVACCASDLGQSYRRQLELEASVNNKNSADGKTGQKIYLSLEFREFCCLSLVRSFTSCQTSE